LNSAHVQIFSMTGKRTLTVGLVGYEFMGKAHSNAWRQAPRFFDLPTHLRLKTICGRDAKAVREVAGKFDWETAATNWRAVVDDPEIDIIDICTPNDSHAEIAIAAAKAGKAVLCEKPLARKVAEAEKNDTCSEASACRQHDLSQLSPHSGDRFGEQMIDRGEIGERICHFRARYAQDWIVDPKFPLVWRLQSGTAGSGALGDIGSHIVDLARYFVGERKEVCAAKETFVKQRPVKTGARQKGKVAVDDAVTIVGRFENGALASLEATRCNGGTRSVSSWENSDATEDIPPANFRRWFPKSTCARRRRSQRA
jgi:predicted dehydrogenase